MVQEQVRQRLLRRRRRAHCVVRCALGAMLGTAAWSGVLTRGALDVPPAFAQDEPKKVIVGKLSGAKPTSAREWIVQGLKDDARFQPIEDDQATSLSGDSSEEEIAELAAELQADAVILGRSSWAKTKGWGAKLSIHDGQDGSLIEVVEVPGGSFEDYESELVGGSAYFAVVDQAVGFPPEEPTNDEEPLTEEVEPEAEPVQQSGAAAGRPSPLDITAGIRLISRSFRYTGTLPQLGAAPADYNLDAGPMPMVALNWYPAAHFTGGWVAHLGLSAGYERGVGTDVNYFDPTAGPQTFGQQHQLWWAGLRGRFPLKAVTLGAEATFGQHTFELTQKDATVDPSTRYPNLVYSNVELAADGEVTVGKVKLGLKGGFVLPLGFGDLASEMNYPEAKGVGVHYRGHVGFSLVPALDIVAGIEGRLYGLNFNPMPLETPPEKLAGGATDSYVSAFLALRVLIPEKRATGAGAGAVESGAEAEGEDDFGDFDSFD